MNQSSAPGKIDHITVLADPDNISLFIAGGKKTVVLIEMTGILFETAIISVKILIFS